MLERGTFVGDAWWYAKTHKHQWDVRIMCAGTGICIIIMFITIVLRVFGYDFQADSF